MSYRVTQNLKRVFLLTLVLKKHRNTIRKRKQDEPKEGEAAEAKEEEKKIVTDLIRFQGSTLRSELPL